jgi:hypothetical protein
MPYVLRESGIVLGLSALCFVAWIANYSLVILIKAGNISDTISYQVRGLLIVTGRINVFVWIGIEKNPGGGGNAGFMSFKVSLIERPEGYFIGNHNHRLICMFFHNQDLMSAAFGKVGFGVLTVLQFMYPAIGE